MAVPGTPPISCSGASASSALATILNLRLLDDLLDFFFRPELLGLTSDFLRLLLLPRRDLDLLFFFDLAFFDFAFLVEDFLRRLLPLEDRLGLLSSSSAGSTELGRSRIFFFSSALEIMELSVDSPPLLLLMPFSFMYFTIF